MKNNKYDTVYLLKNLNSKNIVSKLKNLVQTNFIKNVLTVASGTAMMQVIAMLFSPVLTRLYGPETMGIYGIFLSVASILTPISALTLPIAIVLPKKDEEAEKIVFFSFVLAVFMSFGAFLFIYFWRDVIVNVLQLESIQSMLLLIPLLMLVTAVLDIFSQWHIRQNQFKTIAQIGVAQSLITNILKILIGIVLPTAAVLILVTIAGLGLQAVLLLVFAKFFAEKFLKTLKSYKAYDYTQFIKKYREFPLFRAPQELIYSVSSNLPILMLTALFGPAAAGFYTMSDKVLRVPINLIGSSVGSVFYPRISKAANNNENITNMLVKATMVLIGIGIVPFAFLIIFAPPLFAFVFGSDWETAGIYARWLGLWLFTSFINLPAVKSLPVLKAQKFHLIHTIVTIVCKIAALVIGGFIFKDDVFAVGLYSLVAALLNISLIVITIHKAKEMNEKNG